VNTASVAGIAPTPGATAYAMTKHGVVGLSTSLRGEGAALGVKVSVICPGLIDTPLKDSLTYLNLDKQKMLQHPRIKLHSVEECARVAVRGVRRNRAIITVTPLASRAWRIYRLLPGQIIRQLAGAHSAPGGSESFMCLLPEPVLRLQYCQFTVPVQPHFIERPAAVEPP
jgi:short-subunit dehydrogenase